MVMCSCMICIVSFAAGGMASDNPSHLFSSGSNAPLRIVVSGFLCRFEGGHLEPEDVGRPQWDVRATAAPWKHQQRVVNAANVFDEVQCRRTQEERTCEAPTPALEKREG